MPLPRWRPVGSAASAVADGSIQGVGVTLWAVADPAQPWQDRLAGVAIQKGVSRSPGTGMEQSARSTQPVLASAPVFKFCVNLKV